MDIARSHEMKDSNSISEVDKTSILYSFHSELMASILIRVPMCVMHLAKAKSEEFEFKNRYLHFYQFEIFGIKAAEKQRK